jgi:hypothetical protein
MRRRLAVAVLLTALPLAACAGGGGGGGGPAGGPSDSTGPSASAAAQTVLLQRFGGIAGNQDKITVQPDGSWERTVKAGAGRTGKLASGQRDRLTRMAADPALRSEATRTVPESDCADAFDYALTVGPTKVAWRDCGSATKLPATANGIAQLVLQSTK